MAPSPNKLSQFWQELKRRNVARVITVYAGAAFVILSLVDMIREPFELPNWSFKLVVVILSVGLIIAIILSWIYDIHPEEGIVKTDPADKIKPEEPPRSSIRWKIATYISFVVIAGLIVLNILPRSQRNQPQEHIEKTIAVLPFQNLSGDPGQDFVCQGLTEEIISQLFKIKSFDQVRPLFTVSAYQNSDMSTPEIAEALSVKYILQSSYKRMGNEFKITTFLIEAKSDKYIWQKDFDLPYTEIVSIPGQIAIQIANGLNAFISEDEQKRIEEDPTQSHDAYDLYLSGRQHFNNRHRDGDLWQAIEYFQKAIEKDSTFALAYSGIAQVYHTIANRAIISPKEAYLKAKIYAQHAVELNNSLSDAYLTLGLVKQSFEYKFDEADRDFKKALEISPGNPSTHRSYALFLSLMQRNEEAISYSNKAIELDPLSPITESAKYWVLYAAGNKSQTLEMAEKYRDANPNLPLGYWITTSFYIDLEMYDKALSDNLAAIEIMGGDNISDEIGMLGCIYGKMGEMDQARLQINRLEKLSLMGEYVDPRAYAWYYLGQNNVAKAVEILEQAINDHSFDPLYFGVFPNTIVTNDPHFIELEKKIGLIP